jgi:uncharacterized protein (DUF2237 family)
MFFDQVAFDYRCIGHDLRTAMLENKCTPFAADWISDTACTAQWNAAKVQGKTKPVIFRAVSFDQINVVSSAKSPEPP